VGANGRGTGGLANSSAMALGAKVSQLSAFRAKFMLQNALGIRRRNTPHLACRSVRSILRSGKTIPITVENKMLFLEGSLNKIPK